MARFRLGSCSSCGARIVWVRTERGKRMPMDPEPYHGLESAGVFVLRDRYAAEGPLAIAVAPAAFDEPLYRSHFATCPNADTHRR